jgi:hypothetical protein
MSVLDQLRKLDQERQVLLDKAKAEALNAAEDAIRTLNELGYPYRLMAPNAPIGKPTGEKRTRRAGVRDAVFDTIKQHPDGISRKDLLEAMAATDKKQEQSISNAVAALKKIGQITGADGHYKAV